MLSFATARRARARDFSVEAATRAREGGVGGHARARAPFGRAALVRAGERSGGEGDCGRRRQLEASGREPREIARRAASERGDVRGAACVAREARATAARAGAREAVRRGARAMLLASSMISPRAVAALAVASAFGPHGCRAETA